MKEDGGKRRGERRAGETRREEGRGGERRGRKGPRAQMKEVALPRRCNSHSQQE